MYVGGVKGAIVIFVTVNGIRNKYKIKFSYHANDDINGCVVGWFMIWDGYHLEVSL